MKKFPTLLIVFVATISVLVLSITVHAHPGRTDNNGGHTDHSTGEYHYHHGYPAHSHYDINGDGIIDCPYNFDDKTDHRSGQASGTNKGSGLTSTTTPLTHKNADPNEELKEVPAWVYWIIGTLICTVVILIFCIRGKNKQLVSQENRFQRIAKDDEARVKEGICTLHDALVKRYGNNYLYVISGANPGDFVDNDFLPHSVSYSKSPSMDDYTFYLGGSPYYSPKYHHRSCRYARASYAINAYTLRSKKLYQPCSLCPCRLPDTAWVDRYVKLYTFLNKYVDIHTISKESQQQNPFLGNVTYDMVRNLSNHIGVPFGTAQKLINVERESAGVPPIYFEEKPTIKHHSGGIWDDPDLKINLRD